MADVMAWVTTSAHCPQVLFYFSTEVHLDIFSMFKSQMAQSLQSYPTHLQHSKLHIRRLALMKFSHHVEILQPHTWLESIRHGNNNKSNSTSFVQCINWHSVIRAQFINSLIWIKVGNTIFCYVESRVTFELGPDHKAKLLMIDFWITLDRHF